MAFCLPVVHSFRLGPSALNFEEQSIRTIHSTVGRARTLFKGQSHSNQVNFRKLNRFSPRAEKISPERHSESGQAKPLFFQKGLFSIGQGKKFSFKKQLSEFTKKVGLGPIIAGTIASVATLQFSATFLEQLESVPLLPQFEIFVGTLFSLNLAYSFLRGGEVRARIESLMESAMDGIEGLKGSEDQLIEEPSMLELELKNLVDPYIQLQEIKDNLGSSSIFCTVQNKDSLIISIRDFVNRRESQSRRVNALLRKDNEELRLVEEKYKAQIQQILKEREDFSMTKEAEVFQLRKEKEFLKAEKDETTSKVSSLSKKIDSLHSELKLISAENLKSLLVRADLEARLDQALASDQKMRSAVFSLEASGSTLASQLQRSQAEKSESVFLAEMEKERLLKEQLEIHQTAMAALEVLEKDKIEALEASEKLKVELDDKMDEMVEREQYLNWLEGRLRVASSKITENDRYIADLEAELAESKEYVANSEIHAFSNKEIMAELKAKNEKQEKEVTRVKRKLYLVNKEKEQCLAKIADLEKALDQSEETAFKKELSADELQAALKWASVSETLEPLAQIASKSPIVKEAITRVESAKSLKKSMDFSDLSFGSGTSESVDLAQVEGNEAGSESEEDGEGGSPLNSPNKDLGASNYVGEIAERKLTVSELQKYARKTRTNFVDLQKSPKEQIEGVDALVAALMIKGAEETWARKYVLDAMGRERRKMNKKKQDN